VSDIFRSVERLFEAMSTPPRLAIEDWITDDFQLLEVGEVWDAGALAAAIQGDYQRENFFVLLRAEAHGTLAWVSYWNRAHITRDEDKTDITWLESAVLKQIDGRWRIQLLHSTRVAPDVVPPDLPWQPSNMR